MKWVRTAGIVVLTLGLAAACGSTGHTQPRAETLTSAPATPTTTAPPELATKAQLTAALPSISDMPTGYAVDNSDDSDDGPTNPAGCGNTMDGKIGKPAVDATVYYTSGGGLGGFYSAGAAAYRQDAADLMSSLKKQMSRCAKFTQHDSDGTTTTTLAALSFPKLGDETYALHATMTNSVFTVLADVVYLRVGNCLAYIAQAGLATVDDKLIESTARTIATRLAKLC